MAELDANKFTPAKLELALEYAVEARKAEIDRLWSRSLVFWGLVAAAFVAYGALYDKNGADRSRLLIASFGFLSSLAWTLQNRGSKYWQEAWETKVRVLEKKVFDTALFHNIEPLQSKGLWGARRYSVSKLIIALSDLSVGVWLTLLGLMLKDWTWAQTSHGYFGLGLVVLFALALLVMGRSSPKSNLDTTR